MVLVHRLGSCRLQALPLHRLAQLCGRRIAAGVAELLAARSGQAAPEWTSAVTGASGEVCLVKAAKTMPRLRELCVREGPEPLRRRGLLAPPEFLDVA